MNFMTWIPDPSARCESPWSEKSTKHRPRCRSHRARRGWRSPHGSEGSSTSARYRSADPRRLLDPARRCARRQQRRAHFVESLVQPLHVAEVLELHDSPQGSTFAPSFSGYDLPCRWSGKHQAGGPPLRRVPAQVVLDRRTRIRLRDVPTRTVSGEVRLSGRATHRDRSRISTRVRAHSGAGSGDQRNTSANACDGVLKPRVCRGRPLSRSAMASKSV